MEGCSCSPNSKKKSRSRSLRTEDKSPRIALWLSMIGTIALIVMAQDAEAIGSSLQGVLNGVKGSANALPIPSHTQSGDILFENGWARWAKMSVSIGFGLLVFFGLYIIVGRRRSRR